MRDKGHDCLYCSNEIEKADKNGKTRAYCKFYHDWISPYESGIPPRRNLGNCKGFRVATDYKHNWKEKKHDLKKASLEGRKDFNYSNLPSRKENRIAARNNSFTQSQKTLPFIIGIIIVSYVLLGGNLNPEVVDTFTGILLMGFFGGIVFTGVIIFSLIITSVIRMFE
jgi:hypothetical protein